MGVLEEMGMSDKEMMKNGVEEFSRLQVYCIALLSFVWRAT